MTQIFDIKGVYRVGNLSETGGYLVVATNKKIYSYDRKRNAFGSYSHGYKTITEIKDRADRQLEKLNRRDK